jgi:hypothetical protein
MNYALGLSLKAEGHLEALVAAATAEGEGRASMSTATGSQAGHGAGGGYGMQYQDRDGDDMVLVLVWVLGGMKIWKKKRFGWQWRRCGRRVGSGSVRGLRMGGLRGWGRLCCLLIRIRLFLR